MVGHRALNSGEIGSIPSQRVCFMASSSNGRTPVFQIGNEGFESPRGFHADMMFNGSISGFQPECAGSNPVVRFFILP